MPSSCISRTCSTVSVRSGCGGGVSTQSTAWSAGAAAVVGSYWGIGLAASMPGRRLLEHQVLWRARTTRPEVALTFDDGPHPSYTERFVEALEGAPSTFFMLGEAAAERPELVR